MGKESLYSLILELKEIKKGTSSMDSCAIELIRTTGYVNIVDMLLLPLYYTWEHSHYGTLDDVGFETYLMKAYLRYRLSTKDYTDRIVSVLMKTASKGNLTGKTQTMVNSLIEIYSFTL